MSWLSSFLHPGKGYQRGQQQLDKYYQQAQQFQQPYANNGQQAYGFLADYMKNLSDPQALQDKWSQGYKESDYAKNLEADASQRGLNAASSMGLMGSSPALSAIQQGTSEIGAKDKNQYMQDLMQKYLSGMGLGQNIYGVGANSANAMGQNSMNMGQNSAQMAFGQQNAGGDMFSKILQALASMGTPVAQAWGMNQLGLNNQNMPWSTTGGY